MSDVSDERKIGRLEEKWAARISRCAYNALVVQPQSGDADQRHDDAKQAVEKMLFDSTEWEAVEATVISDIAYEAAYAAFDQA